MLRIFIAGALLSFAQVGSSACEVERRALALCETSTPGQCVVNSDCDADEQCSSGVCVSRPPSSSQTVICECAQRSSDVYLFANYYIGSTHVRTVNLGRISSTHGNSQDVLMDACYKKMASTAICK